jgi:hypothetical protein
MVNIRCIAMEHHGTLKPADPKLRIRSQYEKNIIERAIQYLKDRVEGFDDYYPCLRKGCDLKHVSRWLHLYTYLHNTRRRHIKFTELLSLLEGEQHLS